MVRSGCPVLPCALRLGESLELVAGQEWTGRPPTLLVEPHPSHPRGRSPGCRWRARVSGDFNSAGVSDAQALYAVLGQDAEHC